MEQLDLFTQTPVEKVQPVIPGKEKHFDRPKIIAGLRKSAESCSKQAEKINTEVSGNWTHRRQRFADSAMSKKNALLRCARILFRLADLWEQGNCPFEAWGIRNASDVEYVQHDCFPTPPDDNCPIGGWYREKYPARAKKAEKLGLTNNETFTYLKEYLKELGKEYISPEEQRTRDLKEAMKKVHTYNIPGFFPTPEPLIDRMIELADLSFSEDFGAILEPSAGIGNIADKIKEIEPCAKITCVEISPSLAEILQLKGYNTICQDILEMIEENGFDRIIMNPPFEKAQDIDHVTHCFNTFLRKGGVLVSIMSAGVQSRTDKKTEAFREFVDKFGYFEEVEQGAFKTAFNPTGVSVCICVLNKS